MNYGLIRRHPGMVVELMEEYYDRLDTSREIGFVPLMADHAFYIKDMNFELYREMLHTPKQVYELIYRSILTNSHYKTKILDHDSHREDAQ